MIIIKNTFYLKLFFFFSVKKNISVFLLSVHGLMPFFFHIYLGVCITGLLCLCSTIVSLHRIMCRFPGGKKYLNNSFQVCTTSCGMQPDWEARHNVQLSLTFLATFSLNQSTNLPEMMAVQWEWLIFFLFLQCFTTHFLLSYTVGLSAWISLPRVHFCLPGHIVKCYVLQNHDWDRNT